MLIFCFLLKKSNYYQEYISVYQKMRVSMLRNIHYPSLLIKLIKLLSGYCCIDITGSFDTSYIKKR
jgi:hypothetical protein